MHEQRRMQKKRAVSYVYVPWIRDHEKQQERLLMTDQGECQAEPKVVRYLVGSSFLEKNRLEPHRAGAAPERHLQQ